MDLTRSFAAGLFARGLESWQWAGIGTRVPLFASVFGDVFFRAGDGIWWLNTLEGRASASTAANQIDLFGMRQQADVKHR